MPPKPTDFSTSTERGRQIQQMTADKAEAEAAKERLEGLSALPEPRLQWTILEPTGNKP